MIKGLVFGVIVAVSIGVAGVYADRPSVDLSPPHVKVTYDDYQGHGSATHIGNGYFLTAAHVIKDGETPLVDGNDAIILWVNNDYDIALLRANVSNMDAANLECRDPVVGEDVSVYGNPFNLEGIITWGKVSGKSRTAGPWDLVAPINAAIAPGMSGGALLDSDDDLIGVNVGVMVMPVGLGGGPVSIGYIVPSSVICMLMGVDR